MIEAGALPQGCDSLLDATMRRTIRTASELALVLQTLDQLEPTLYAIRQVEISMGQLSPQAQVEYASELRTVNRCRRVLGILNRAACDLRATKT